VGVSERRQREKELRRESIVDAAERVFVRDGYEASTMDHVSSEAEVSKGTLYLYFQNKDELRAAIGERWVSRLIDRLRPRLASARSGLDGVRAVLHSYHEHFQRKPDHCRLTLAWVSNPPDASCCGESFAAHRARVQELVGMVVETIERGREDGSIRRDVEPPLVALQLWGGFLGVWMLAMNGMQVQGKLPAPVDLDALIPAFHETVLRGLAGPAAAALAEAGE
jgi:AcrR family transcriptional regulator